VAVALAAQEGTRQRLPVATAHPAFRRLSAALSSLTAAVAAAVQGWTSRTRRVQVVQAAAVQVAQPSAATEQTV